MSNWRLLWVGHSGKVSDSFHAVLESEIGGLAIDRAVDGRQCLTILGQDPAQYEITVIELKMAGMDLGALVTGIKQINPAIEIVVLKQREPRWERLSLPRYYRPILLDERCGSDVLLSCVAKLKEMVEAKEDHGQLSRLFRKNVVASRKGTVALLNLLSRQNSLGVIAMRRDGFFVTCNEEAQRLTGYSSDELAHMQIWVQTLFLDFESVRSFLATIERFWAGDAGVEETQIRIRNKQGRVLTLSMALLVVPDEAGQARQMVALFFDPSGNREALEYGTLMDCRKCGLYTYLPGHGFTRMSRGALDLVNRTFGLNLTLDELLGRQITEIPIPQETAEVWQKALERFADGTPFDSDHLAPLGLPGRRIMGHELVVQVDPGHGNQCPVLAMVLPREDLLANTFHELPADVLIAEALNVVPHPLLVLRSLRDNRGRITDFLCAAVNPTGQRLLGLNEVIPARTTLSDMFSDDDTREIVLETARNVAETGKNKELETWLRLRGKGDQPSRVCVWIGKIGDGVAILMHDVTAIREESRQLRQYRHMFSHMQEAMIITDLQGNVIDWNPASERMFGYTFSQILGRPAEILTQNPRGEQVEQQTRNVLRDGNVWRGEYEFVRGDGTRGIASSVFAMLRDDQGMPDGTVGLCQDLTEQKRFEEILTAKSQELQEKNLALNTLLRHAEAERARACEQMALDLTRRVSDRVHKILEAKGDPLMVENQAALLLQDLGGSRQSETIDVDDPRLKLSGKEMEVAQLIRLGKTTEEIAFLLKKSPDTIRLQRISIRKKLGLTRRDHNLAGYLKQIDLT